MTTESDEQRAQAKLIEIAEFATRLIDRSGTPEGFNIQPGSPLAVDDSLSSPYQVSFAARACLTTAIDHLHAACALVLKTGFLHVAAPATVVRGVLECASTALWMLAPAASEERITRGLRWYIKDVSDGDKAATEIGISVPTPLQKRKDKIKAVADARGLPFDTIKRGYSSTEAVTAAKTHLDSQHPLDVLFYWRLCSGFAHGRAWPMLGFAEVLEKLPTADPTVSMTKTENTYERVLALTMTAALTTKSAVVLYDKLGTAP
ncbi:hypothetical protein [Saccharothrix texasensis]|uniref:Uncharacterized protein n=1 Tax=Saccharothrix texasensis TaxID=103734 RepID=A0A3N1HDX2_9PSEU|nr:hypothetical protein [Saccharothrix texasensis]ROP40709.1 hypothetical protein EDD40_6126 [Saccharothrix texasensis]